MFLKELNRPAKVAWCPVPQHACLLAAGGTAFNESTFQNTTQLQIYDANLSDGSTAMHSVGSVLVPDQIQALAWGEKGCQENTNPAGVIATGLETGPIHIWDPVKVMSGDAQALAVCSQHKMTVNCLEFHPKKDFLLASGSMDGDVLIWDLKTPQPRASTLRPPSSGYNPPGVSCLAWNHKVTKILAAANEAGEINIFDLRTSRAIMKLKNQKRAPARINAIKWHPEMGTQLAVCSQGSPVVELWDMKKQSPKHELLHSQQGTVFDIEWTPKISGVLVSVGDDGCTNYWDTKSWQMLKQESPQQVQNGQVVVSQEVQWAPALDSIMSASSMDGKVYVKAVHDLGEYVPDWLKRPCGASFGFGGSLVSFSPSSTSVNMSMMASEPQVVELATEFEEILKEGNFPKLCKDRMEGSKNEINKLTWKFLSILSSEDSISQRNAILKELGFECLPEEQEPEPVAEAKEEPPKPKPEPVAAPPPQVNEPEQEEDDVGFWDQNFSKDGEEDQEDEGEPPKKEPPVSESAETAPAEAPAKTATVDPEPDYKENEDEKRIREALVVKNLRAAARICLESGRMADALILGVMAGKSVFQEVQNAYFKSHEHPFFKSVLRYITSEKPDYQSIVDNSHLSQWKQTLSVLLNYVVDQDEYHSLIDRLADRLHDAPKAELRQQAIFCYLLSNNVTKAVEIWTSEAQERGLTPAEVSHKALEKISVFSRAIGGAPVPVLCQRYMEYAAILASDGKFDAALTYLQFAGAGGDPAVQEFQERIQVALQSRTRNLKEPEMDGEDDAAFFESAAQQSSLPTHLQAQQQQQQQPYHQQHNGANAFHNGAAAGAYPGQRQGGRSPPQHGFAAQPQQQGMQPMPSFSGQRQPARPGLPQGQQPAQTFQHPQAQQASQQGFPPRREAVQSSFPTTTPQARQPAQPPMPSQPMPGQPQARPGFSPSGPGPMPGFPGQASGHPAGQPSFPGQSKGQPSFPGQPSAQPSFPGQPSAQPSFPGQPSAQPSFPGPPAAQPSFPGQPRSRQSGPPQQQQPRQPAQPAFSGQAPTSQGPPSQTRPPTQPGFPSQQGPAAFPSQAPARPTQAFPSAQQSRPSTQSQLPGRQQQPQPAFPGAQGGQPQPQPQASFPSQQSKPSFPSQQNQSQSTGVQSFPNQPQSRPQQLAIGGQSFPGPAQPSAPAQAPSQPINGYAAQAASPDLQRAQSVLNQVFDSLKSRPLKSADQKKLVDIERRLAVLYQAMPTLSPTATASIVRISHCLQQKDYKGALDTHHQLVQADFTGNSQWIPGIKTLIKSVSKIP